MTTSAVVFPQRSKSRSRPTTAYPNNSASINRSAAHHRARGTCPIAGTSNGINHCICSDPRPRTNELYIRMMLRMNAPSLVATIDTSAFATTPDGKD